MAHIKEDKPRVIPRHSGKDQATNEDKYWGCFEKVNSLSSVNMVACVTIWTLSHLW
jgi:hypothetical protein